MGKDDFTKVTTESILLEELGPERAGSVHTTLDDGDKKDAGKKEEAPPAKMGDFFRVLRFGTKFDWFMIGLCFFSALASGIAMPLMFLVFGRMVGDFTAYFNTTPPITIGNFTFKPDVPTKAEFVAEVNKNALYMTYLGLARFVLSYIAFLSIRISGLRISARLRLAYLKALFLQPVDTIDETSPGVIASRLTTNCNTIENGISQQFSFALQAISFTLGLYIVSFAKSFLLTLVASASLPIALIAYAFALPLLNKYYYKGETVKDEASTLAFEMFESIRIVVAFGAEGRLGTKHQEILRRAQKFDRKQAPLMGLLMAPMFLAVVLFSVLWAVMTLYRLSSPITQIIRAAAASAEIFHVLDAKVPDITGFKDPDVSVAEDVVFKNVSFSYPSRPDTTILDGLSVSFEAGKTTAIVGPSGSGKSTVVGLLERWYNPTPPSPRSARSSYSWLKNDEEELEFPDKIEKGMPRVESSSSSKQSGIFIGDTRLSDIDVKWWRSNVGLVQQEPFLFNDTIFNNVANGLSGTKWEHSPAEMKSLMVEWACKEAFADEFIQKLPLGYDTMVGKSGMKMSGGQRQRIAIARAIVKEPQILILDEATSAIDVRTEKIVQKALDRVSKSRTTITIAHRLSTIKKADKIVVLRAGQLVEQGTHEQLLRDEDGVYSGFVRAQNVEMGDNDDQDIEEDEITIDEQAQVPTVSPGLLSSSPAEFTQKAEKEGKAKGCMRSLGVLIYEQRKNWWLYLLTLIGVLGGGATYPVQAYFFAKVVETFTLARAQLVSRGNFWALMFGIQAVVVGLAFLCLGWAASLVSTVVSTFYRQECLENMVRKRIPYFDREENSPGALAARLSTDASHLQQLLGTEMGMSLVGVLSIVGSIIISFVFGWKLSLVGIGIVMPIILAAGYWRVSLESSNEKLNAVVFAETSQFGAEAIAGFRTVTALTMEEHIEDRFEELLSAHAEKALKKAKWATLVFAFSDSADLLCQALVFWYGGMLLANREYSVVNFFVIYMAVTQSTLAAGMWFSFSPNIVEATAAANRILSCRLSPAEREQQSRKMPTNDGPAGIEFKDVSFSYTDRDTTVLDRINLKIEPGQFAAFVGASGSGKSTMISLLERFYEPTSGKILFDGENIAEVDAASYRKNLSIVAQESTLYQGTIRENIALSVPESEATDAAITAACTSAQIHTFITSLPNGYATQIGSKGIALSGGQRQRLALARALLRKPQLLLLDESTSNLDSESERQVQQAIEKAARGGRRTIIAVAHRLATIQNADVIFVLGSGGVLERGGHRELLALRGVYYGMCQSQALDR
ncbi:P-loop containing nucleoside triphosphate hydrolase protein [Venturia nashicola]|nr:P-loop containing nucleoside triphosphate hydrolase protein [Venturia nashicola]